MGLLYIIAGFMRNALSWPFQFLQFMRQWKQNRMALEHASRSVAKEATEAKSAGGFFKRLGKIVLIILAILLIAGIFWMLYGLNQWFDLPKWLSGPFPWMRPFWLPLLVVLFLATLFAGWRLWKMLGPDKDDQSFPDLDLAWAEAQSALVQAGINVRQAPMFLVLGRPNSSLDAWFTASKSNWIVRQKPMRVDAPIQVYANQQGVFVALLDSSLTGRVLDQIRKQPPVDPALTGPRESVFDIVAANASAQPTDAEATLTGPNLLADQSSLHDIHLPDAGSVRRTSLRERNEERVQARRKPLSQEDAFLAQRRMAYATRIIGRERRPYCAFNGIVALLPVSCLPNNEESSQVIAGLESDLRMAREVGLTRCPFWAVATDLETSRGFDGLFSALDPEHRARLMGQEFPLWPDLKPGAFSTQIDQGVDDFMASVSGLVLKLFQVEAANLTPKEAVVKNCKLFEFLGDLRQSRPGLEKIARRLVEQETPEGLYFGGFYLAATGADPEANQAFVPGILRTLIEQQNKVTWTPTALAEEADYQRWANFGYAVTGLFCILLCVLAYLRWTAVG